jgi:hypothetical protein
MPYRRDGPLAEVIGSTGQCPVFLNLQSRSLTGNSVRRAGSNSPPRSGPQPEPQRGPWPDSVHSFFESFEHSSPGDGETRNVHFAGWVGIFAA